MNRHSLDLARVLLWMDALVLLWKLWSSLSLALKSRTFCSKVSCTSLGSSEASRKMRRSITRELPTDQLRMPRLCLNSLRESEPRSCSFFSSRLWSQRHSSSVSSNITSFCLASLHRSSCLNCSSFIFYWYVCLSFSRWYSSTDWAFISAWTCSCKRFGLYL